MQGTSPPFLHAPQRQDKALNRLSCQSACRWLAAKSNGFAPGGDFQHRGAPSMARLSSVPVLRLSLFGPVDVPRAFPRRPLHRRTGPARIRHSSERDAATCTPRTVAASPPHASLQVPAIAHRDLIGAAAERLSGPDATQKSQGQNVDLNHDVQSSLFCAKQVRVECEISGKSR